MSINPFDNITVTSELFFGNKSTGKYSEDLHFKSEQLWKELYAWGKVWKACLTLYFSNVLQKHT